MMHVSSRDQKEVNDRRGRWVMHATWGVSAHSKYNSTVSGSWFRRVWVGVVDIPLFHDNEIKKGACATRA